MARFEDIALFVRTADLGSLSAAARLLDVSPAVASLGLKRLERDLDAKLIVRSTRSLRLTAAGRRYLEHARRALEHLEEGQRELAAEAASLEGTLRISAPSDFGRNILLSWLDAFQRQHPRLRLDLVVSDATADLFRSNIDVALRYGKLRDSTHVALPLAPEVPRVLCASPLYIQQFGRPRTLDELQQHRCLVWTRNERPHDAWEFIEAGKSRTVQVKPYRVSNDGEIVHRWALSGQGIAYKSKLDVSADIRSGALVHLLPECEGESSPLSFVCIGRAHLTCSMRALHEHLKQACDELTKQWAEAARRR